jgi:hypothetical protein
MGTHRVNPLSSASVSNRLTLYCLVIAAGNMVRHGESQVVAIKIVELKDCTPTQVAAANKEIAVLC